MIIFFSKHFKIKIKINYKKLIFFIIKRSLFFKIYNKKYIKKIFFYFFNNNKKLKYFKIFIYQIIKIKNKNFKNLNNLLTEIYFLINKINLCF
ncbi:hypothetical protein [Candidatus Nasuia deltocephalinicola]|uniref:hypothetical protein n=1 Tax=Candidatus Nasuia deltocephalincola TaxID=1160784 RepID=UPI00216AFEAB|nr:hypothetical protein [Candidatus Nasuia deltocephalinicola]